jgi:hypothetical protein
MPKRAKRKSGKLNPVNSGKMSLKLGPQAIAEILKASHPDRSPLPAQVFLAELFINLKLREIKFRPDYSQTDVSEKIFQLTKDFKSVKRRLNDQLTRSLLKTVGMQFELLPKKDRPPRYCACPLGDRVACSGDYIEDVLQRLDRLLKEALTWLERDEIVEGVIDEYAPKPTTYASLIRWWARAYEVIFREHCAAACEGAGPTFILEIFRKSGIHSGGENTIRELIHVSLRRWRDRESVSAELRNQLKLIDAWYASDKGRGIVQPPRLLLKRRMGQVYCRLSGGRDR